jgi:hypothetical protein
MTCAAPIWTPERRPRPANASVGAAMPRIFFWTQALIVVFVLAGIVIAVTRLA